MRVYMTDAAARILRTRDALPSGVDPEELRKDALERIGMCEAAIAKLAGAYEDDDCSCDAVNPSERMFEIHAEERERTRQTLAGAKTGFDSDELADTPSSINSKNKLFWETPNSPPTASAGGSPSTTPAPGNANTARGENFMPGNAGDEPLRLSRTGKAEGMLGKRGYNGTTTDADKAYFAANSRLQATVRKMNEAGRVWNSTGAPPVSKPVASTRDSVSPDSAAGAIKFAGHVQTATIAQISAKMKSHRWGS